MCACTYVRMYIYIHYLTLPRGLELETDQFARPLARTLPLGLWWKKLEKQQKNIAFFFFANCGQKNEKSRNSKFWGFKSCQNLMFSVGKHRKKFRGALGCPRAIPGAAGRCQSASGCRRPSPAAQQPRHAYPSCTAA